MPASIGRRWLWGLALVVLPAGAHHSFVVDYDVRRSVTVEGTVVAFLYRNPHAVLKWDVTTPNGQVQHWRGEWGSRGQLGREGVGGDTLRVGDRVQVTGNPMRREGPHQLRVQAVRRPGDGWVWQGTTK